MSRRTIAVLLVTLNMAGFCAAQVATGAPAFSSIASGPFDSVNLGNLNVHFTVPVLHKAGRGIAFDYDLFYDSSVWAPAGVSGNQNWQPAGNWGWTDSWSAATGYLTNSSFITFCYDNQGHPNGETSTTSSWVFHDQWGIKHSFLGQIVIYAGGCTGTNITSFSSPATDGSG